MKKTGYKLFVAVIAFSGLMTACSDTFNPAVDVIKIEGVSWVCNVNTSYAIFGSSSETEELLEVSLPASAGDLLYMIKDDLDFYYRYSPENGRELSVCFDTVNAVSVYLNGKLEYMELSGPASLEAFSQLSDPEVKQLSTIYIHGPISEDYLMALKNHETVLSGKGLVVEGREGSDNFYDILSICQPSFLVIDDLGLLPDPEDGTCVSKLELLWVEGNIPALTKLANCCSNLESLIVANWEPAPGELLPLAGLKKLQSITIADSEITSLGSIEFPETLRKLYLVDCDTLSDISKLGELQNLVHLSLSECDQVENVDILLDLERLKWLSFPPNVRHNEFGKLTKGHTQLETVELIACTEIKDLAALQALPELDILVLQLEKEQLGTLDSLEHLKLLILANEMFKDNPKWIKELRASLPNTSIVPGSGLCLGSGWLLLLLPFIMLFRHISRRKI